MLESMIPSGKTLQCLYALCWCECEFALCLITQCLLLPDVNAVLACDRSSIGRAQQNKVFSVHAEYDESVSADAGVLLDFNMYPLLWASDSKIKSLLFVPSVISGVLSPARTAMAYVFCRNDWLVLPQNQRIIGGLTFQPHTLF